MQELQAAIARNASAISEAMVGTRQRVLVDGPSKKNPDELAAPGCRTQDIFKSRSRNDHIGHFPVDFPVSGVAHHQPVLGIIENESIVKGFDRGIQAFVRSLKRIALRRQLRGRLLLIVASAMLVVLVIAVVAFNGLLRQSLDNDSQTAAQERAQAPRERLVRKE